MVEKKNLKDKLSIQKGKMIKKIMIKNSFLDDFKMI
jgi:hypothetical protein